MPDPRDITVPADLSGQTLAAVIKRMPESGSWSEVKRAILGRQVKVNGALCLDEARRMKTGERVVVAGSAAAPPQADHGVQIVYRDEHLVIVEKPPGIQTVRRPEEREFSEEKKRRQPTLDEVVASLLASRKLPARHGRVVIERTKVRAVHRLDRDTSGLMLFALSPAAEAALVKQFAAHQVQRTYTAVVHGSLRGSKTIETMLVRDRGDGLRGSLPKGATEGSPNESPQRAVTHVRATERIGDRFTVLACKLETGRTHQIRIHLSEMGHRLCGELIYTRPGVGAEPLIDDSGAPRQALHSTDLFLKHPITGAELRFSSPLPRDLAKWLASLRG